MKEKDVAIVQQVALEKVLVFQPRYITDNGKQFTGKEFQKFIPLHGMTHVKTSPNYPQSNGKVERFHCTIKNECIRLKALLGQVHAKAVIGSYIDSYNNQRLHSANGYIVPLDQLIGRDTEIQQERRKKLNQAKLERKQRNLIVSEIYKKGTKVNYHFSK